MDDVVISGMGMVSALGHSVEESFASAQRGTCGIRRCDELLEHGDDLPARVAATVEGLDRGALALGRRAEVFSRGTVYAVAAADEALAQADIPYGPGRDRVGVLCGAAGPSVDLFVSATQAMVRAGNTAGLSGAHAPHLSAHAPAAVLALRHELRGPNFALSAACSTGSALLLIGADLIRMGRADAMLVGATESCVGSLVMGSFVRARAVNPTDDPRGACRPFDARRRGLVFGEGSGFFFIERRSSAQARGAPVLGAIRGGSLTNDAHHMWAPSVESWSRTITMALERAEVDPRQVDYVSAHAAGTPIGDAAETRALELALGDHAHRVPVSATKGMHGHAFAASSAFETILALRAMEVDEVLPTVGLETPDPACDLDCVTGAPRSHRSQMLLKNAFGFGGTNCALVLEGGRA